MKVFFVVFVPFVLSFRVHAISNQDRHEGAKPELAVF